jgi:phage gp46-like protein
MSDIRTYFFDFRHGADWLLADQALASDDGLDTAIIISLFTDARAQAGDVTPAKDDLRGWWGDDYAAVPGDRIGSRLWLLTRRKQLNAVLNEAKSYAEEALRWLVRDNIASRVIVVASIPRPEVLGLEISIVRPQGQPVRYRFETLWASI